MRRLALLLLTLAVAAPAVSAQGFLDRARRAVQNATGSAQSAAQDAVPQPSAAVEGQPLPASDYASLLETRFYSDSGGFYIDGSDATALFVRDGATGKYVLRNPDGIALAEVPVTGTIDTRAPVIRRLDMRGAFPNERIAPLADGIYWLNLEMGGAVLGSVPFEVAEHGSADPFDPQPVYLRDGPWRSLAYLDQPVGGEGNNAQFTVYIAPDDLPAGETSIEVAVYEGSRQVACMSRGHVDHINRDWSAVRSMLYSGTDCTQARTRGALHFADFNDGPYQFRVTSGGKAVRTFTLETANGAPTPHPRSALDYAPRHDYLTPRRVWRQTGWHEHELIWLSADR